MKVKGCISSIVFSVLLFWLFKTSQCKYVLKQEQGINGPVVNMMGPDESPKESWAYVKVRPKANMFYWLYRTTHARGYLERPLIMWLQGGPGASSTGFGNFKELGPLDVDLKPRNTTWLQTASLLFVDNPVGSGYSYVEDESSYTKNVAEIAADLLALMKAFLKNHSEFQKIPFYIFSESYGGKMTAAFSAVLSEEIKEKELIMNFQGLAMGDSWISPVDSVLSWGPYLHAMSFVSEYGKNAIIDGAKKCEKLVSEGKFAQATEAWQYLENKVEDVAAFVNFYNIMNFDYADPPLRRSDASPLEKLYQRHVKVLQRDDLSDLMNGPIRKKLKIVPDHVVWGAQSSGVFSNQIKDFMKNVTNTVNALINEKKLKVVIYSGQFDLICDVLGTEAWFSRLNISKAFKTSEKETFSCGHDNPVCYFGSKHENTQFYWILNAGHMVPADNGPAALSMVSQIIG